MFIGHIHPDPAGMQAAKEEGRVGAVRAEPMSPPGRLRDGFAAANAETSCAKPEGGAVKEGSGMRNEKMT